MLGDYKNHLFDLILKSRLLSWLKVGEVFNALFNINSNHQKWRFLWRSGTNKVLHKINYLDFPHKINYLDFPHKLCFILVLLYLIFMENCLYRCCTWFFSMAENKFNPADIYQFGSHTWKWIISFPDTIFNLKIYYKSPDILYKTFTKVIFQH